LINVPPRKAMSGFGAWLFAAPLLNEELAATAGHPYRRTWPALSADEQMPAFRGSVLGDSMESSFPTDEELLAACIQAEEELHRQRALQLDFPSPFTARRHRLLDPDAGDVALSLTAEHDSPPESAEEVKNLIAGKVSNKATRDWQ